ncbi:MAG: ATP-binding protein [Rhodothermales bacterium]|nr:ATP-binding protein [Rhodothermales bacterium]
MTLDDVTRLARTGEGQHLEFKKRIPEGARFAKEVAAFANSGGGILLIGVDDDGTVTGVRDREEELFALRSILDTFCSPPVAIDIELVHVSRRREVIVIRVSSSGDRPHYVQKDERQVVYIRASDQSVEASAESTRLMKLRDADVDVAFEFGDRELSLMRYLDEYGQVTVDQFASLVNIPEEDASDILVVLTRASLLNIHPSERSDFFTIARSKAG